MPVITPLIEEYLFLSKWGCTLTILFTPSGPYCVLCQLCKVVSVEDVRQQYEQLLRRQATQEYTTKLPVQTPHRGKQVTYCIQMDILAWWLAGLSEKQIRPEFAPKLVRCQKDVVRAASDILPDNPAKDAPLEEVAKGKIIRLGEEIAREVRPRILFGQGVDTGTIVLGVAATIDTTVDDGEMPHV